MLFQTAGSHGLQLNTVPPSGFDICLEGGQHAFLVKGQMINILDFVGHLRFLVHILLLLLFLNQPFEKVKKKLAHGL